MKDKRTLPMFSPRVTTVYRSGPLKGLPKYPEDGMKRCVRCREPFAFESFHEDPHQPDGRSNICALCKNTYARKLVAEGRIKKRVRKKREMVQEELFT